MASVKVLPVGEQIQPSASLQLFAFPYAGGHADTFKTWDKLFAQVNVSVDMFCAVLPSRTGGLNAKVTFTEVVEMLCDAVSERLDGRPYALMGHSLGASLAYEVSREMVRRKFPAPIHLCISSVLPASHDDFLEHGGHTSKLSDVDFIARAEANGWLTKMMDRSVDAATLKVILAPLRWDVELYEDYRWVDDDAKLAGQRVLIIGGDNDPIVPISILREWKGVAGPDAMATVEIIEGGRHFHMETHTSQVVALLGNAINAALAALPRAMTSGEFREWADAPFLQRQTSSSVTSPCLHTMFSEVVRRIPDRLALVCTSTASRYSFAQLQTHASVLCRVLRTLGVRANENVGLMTPTNAANVVADLAILSAGASIMTFYTNYSSELISDLLEVTRSKVIICAPDYLSSLPAVFSGDGGGESEPGLVTALRAAGLLRGGRGAANEQCYSLVLPTDADLGKALEQYKDALMADQPALKNQFPLYCEPTTVKPRDPAMCSFSSGTTGRPKAIIVSHETTIHCFLMRYESMPYIDANGDFYGIGSLAKDPPTKTALPPTPEREGLNTFFVWEILRPLLRGVPAFVIPDTTVIQPTEFAAYLQEHRITRLMATPSLTKNILDLVSDLSEKLKHMRHWMVMGEVLPQSTVLSFQDKLPHVDFVNSFSTWESLELTECHLNPNCTLKASKVAPRQKALGNFALCGFCYPNITLMVVSMPEVDEEATKQPTLWNESQVNICPIGVWGRVVAAGWSFSSGYMGDPQKTKARFHKVPRTALKVAASSGKLQTRAAGPDEVFVELYDTGDSGRLLSDGQLQLRGRDDGTVKIRGFKVALGWVQTSLEGCTDVAAVTIVPHKNPKTANTEHLLAYVLPRAGSQSASLAFAEAVLEEATELLPEYAVPRFVMAMSKMPLRAGSNKIDYKRLPGPNDADFCAALGASDPVVQDDDVAEVQDASGGGLLRAVLKLWEAVLHKESHSEEKHVLKEYENFFQVGGHSLMAATLVARLKADLGLVHLTVLDIFEHPTVAGLVGHLQAQKRPAKVVSSKGRSKSLAEQHVGKVAVVGMSGIFPGDAGSVDALWEVLQNGSDTLRTLTREELERKAAAGSDAARAALSDPDWVPVAQALRGAEHFDCHFWGIGKREAELMDPQQRLFLQTAYHALEHAGYAPLTTAPRKTAVFAACGIDGYLVHHLDGGGLKSPLSPGELFLTEVGNEKDYIATRVSYQLDLQGPSYTINSACSSGLVAIARAANEVMTNPNCDMAVAGAAAVTFPNLGYKYSDGLVASADGKVRPFDSEASGTLFGDSVGAVVLKPLAHAIEDGDTIYSVVSGHAVTNDGQRKAAFSAPNASAQARAIRQALTMARVHPHHVGYVECHATATKVGDAIEARGLTSAYAQLVRESDKNDKDGLKRQGWKVAVGSVKGNIGHANCAAGVTGFIKATLCLHHKTLVPTAHFKQINPKVRPIFRSSPFYVHERTQHWEGGYQLEGAPALRVAGVSSFGVGGTNCHIVLEEGPAVHAEAAFESAPGRLVNPYRVFPLSAKTLPALARIARSLSSFARDDADKGSDRLLEIAHTLQTGRERFQYRACVVASSTTELADDLDQLARHIDTIAAIANPEEQRAALFPSVKPVRGPYGEGAGGKAGVAPVGVWVGDPRMGGKSVVFAFSGQGAQHAHMGREVYAVDPVVRGIIQQCCRVLREPGFGGLDLLPFFETDDNGEGEAIDLSKAALLQPLLFVVEYALARALLEYGVEPLAVIGHSIGEISAAAFAKALSVRDALKLMVARGRLCDAQGRSGQMLSVSMTLDQAEAFVQHFNAAHKQDQALASDPSDRGLEVALNNAATLQVLVGSAAAVARAKADLEHPTGSKDEQAWRPDGEAIRCVVLHVQYPFHSSRMQAAADALVQWDAQARTTFAAPSLPMTSNVHSGWLQTKPDAAYWAAHLTRTVRFAANAKAVLKWNPDVIVEVGPGVALSKLFSREIAGAGGEEDPVLLHTMRSPRAAQCEGTVLWTSMLARLWVSGVAVNWTKRNEYLFRHSSTHARPATPSGLSRALASVFDPATDDAAAALTDSPPAKRVGSQRVGLPTYAFEPMAVWSKPEASIYVSEPAKSKKSKHKSKKSKKKNKHKKSKPKEGSEPTLPQSDTLLFMTRQQAVRHAAQARMYCFPFAGGSARSFAQAFKQGAFQLHGHPEGTLDVVAVELPGRGQRAEEPLPTTEADDRAQVQRIAADILADVADLPRARVVLVGLSMGALWALETAKELQRMGLQVDELAIVGRCPITITPGQPQPTEVSKEDVEALAMASDEVRATPEWKNFFLPLLMSDLATDNRFQRFLAPSLTSLALECDVTVVCGMQDKSFDWKRAQEWEVVTSRSDTFHLHMLPGPHQFLLTSLREIFRVIAHGRQSFSSPGGTASILHSVAWRPVGLLPAPEEAQALLPPVIVVSGAGARMGSGAEVDLDAVALAAIKTRHILVIIDTPAIPACHTDPARADWLKSETDAAWAFASTVRGVLQHAATHGVDPAATIRLVLVGPSAGVMPGVSGALAFGASKCIPLEFAELSAVGALRVSVPREAVAQAVRQEGLETLWKAIQKVASTGETDVTLSAATPGAVMRSPRLLHVPVGADLTREQLVGPAESNGLLLLTGATGGIGTEVLKWLIFEMGVPASRLVVLTRHQSWALEGAPGLRTVTVDCSDRDALLQCSDLTSLSNVVGIMHLAGALADGLLAGMDRSKFEVPLRPKAALLPLLSLAASTWDTQWVAVFSSTTGLLGYPGQTNYGAANHFMDALCEGKSGRPVLVSVNWGPWGEVGMAKAGSRAYNLALQHGEVPLATRAAIAALATALGQALSGGENSHFMVGDMRWPRTLWANRRIAAAVRAANAPPPTSEVAAPAPAAAAHDDSDSDEGSASSEGEEQDAVQHFLESSVSAWMPAETLSALGVDSLDEVQMRNDFQRTFQVQTPLSLFTNPNLTLYQLWQELKALVGKN